MQVIDDLANTLSFLVQVLTFAAYGELLAVHNSLSSNSPIATRLSSLGYSGEHFDAKAQQQYLRARFYDPTNGRFNRLDPFAGNTQDPQSLHKYAYVHGDPVQGIDPTGMFSLGSINVASAIRTSMSKISQGAVYSAKQAGLASLDTALEFSVANLLNILLFPGTGGIDFQFIRSFESNFFSRLATGWIKRDQISGKVRALKGLAEIGIRTAVDSHHGEKFWLALLINSATVGLGEVGAALGPKILGKLFPRRPGRPAPPSALPQSSTWLEPLETAARKEIDDFIMETLEEFTEAGGASDGNKQSP